MNTHFLTTPFSSSLPMPSLTSVEKCIIFFSKQQNIGINYSRFKYLSAAKIYQNFGLYFLQKRPRFFAMTRPHPLVGSDNAKISVVTEQRKPFSIENW